MTVRTVAADATVAGAGGALGAAAAIALGYSPGGVAVTALFVGALAGIAMIDLRERRIPNAYTYTGTLMALAAAALGGPGPLTLAALGLLAAGGAMAVMYLLGRGRLGMGDVKLCAFAGSVLAKYGSHGTPLASGYLLGFELIQGYAAALDVELGEGHVLLLGFRPQWRGQPFGSFRVLFNACLFHGQLGSAGPANDGFWEPPPKEEEQPKQEDEQADGRRRRPGGQGG